MYIYLHYMKINLATVQQSLAVFGPVSTWKGDRLGKLNLPLFKLFLKFAFYTIFAVSYTMIMVCRYYWLITIEVEKVLKSILTGPNYT